MSDIDKRRVAKTDLTYEEMQTFASHKDSHIRCILAERLDLPPEILYFLAEDNDCEVRRLIALNPTTPRQADLLLARDVDTSVRCDLTEKIAQLAPDASATERSKIQDLTYDALSVLSRDQVTSVRQILSEALKDVVDAPGDIIRLLAKDMEVVVSGPVLQFSPVLTDEDLIEIISSRHSDAALNAISKRQSISESVSNAVIKTNEESAIADLLSNPTAQIREDTLDMLADRAQDVLTWHAPLSRRPKLSLHAAKRMAHYLADNLLKTMQERKDLPDDVISSLKEEVKKRIDGVDDPKDEEIEIDPIEEVRALHKDKKLNEELLCQWVDESNWIFVTSGLAVLSELRRVTVKKIVASQSGKGLMALTWKAGLSPQMGETIQFKVAKMPIPNILKMTEKNEFPLDDQELSWHLELFDDG